MASKDHDEKDVKKLLKEVKKLKDENKKLKSRKKYGIVWEEEKEPEKVVLECKEKEPILKEVKDKEILTDKEKPMNLLIEGDNYHALQVLNYTHKVQVDVIYIEPPFNTGAKNWKYNNNYVDKDDSYRHSKWLNLMNKRLKLAKELLKEDGVLICAIDENELWHLGCLLEDIFFNHEKEIAFLKKQLKKLDKIKSEGYEKQLLKEFYEFRDSLKKNRRRKNGSRLKRRTKSRTLRLLSRIENESFLYPKKLKKRILQILL